MKSAVYEGLPICSHSETHCMGGPYEFDTWDPRLDCIHLLCYLWLVDMWSLIHLGSWPLKAYLGTLKLAGNAGISAGHYCLHKYISWIETLYGIYAKEGIHPRILMKLILNWGLLRELCDRCRSSLVSALLARTGNQCIADAVHNAVIIFICR